MAAGFLAAPLLVALFGLLCATVLALFSRRRAGLVVVALACSYLYAAASPLVANGLLEPLESRYEPLVDAAIPKDVAAIVVLGSSYVPRRSVPVTAALSDDGLVRAVEGIRLLHVLEGRAAGVVLYLSGGGEDGEPPGAEGYGRLARELGVPESRVRLVPEPLDTAQEARIFSKLLRGQRFILVTSAYHMPRAMLLFERVGARPLAAPTGHWIRQGGVWRPGWQGLRRTERALLEYFAILAVKVGLY
jgi:uncharacterized SAM-binding protein YcdF (DUF218 family)